MRLPTVLFVDQDENALNRIFLHVEPDFMSLSVHKVPLLKRYIEKFHPDVVVISDRVKDRRNCPSVVASLREYYDGGILVLTECIDERERVSWREQGANDCVLHPTRIEERLNAMSRKITDIFNDGLSKGIAGGGRVPGENR